MNPVEQLTHDLEIGGDEGYAECAKRLYELGYRMPDCSDRWQVDRLTGAVFGAARQAGALEEIARLMIENAGVSK